MPCHMSCAWFIRQACIIMFVCVLSLVVCHCPVRWQQAQHAFPQQAKHSGSGKHCPDKPCNPSEGSKKPQSRQKHTPRNSAGRINRMTVDAHSTPQHCPLSSQFAINPCTGAACHAYTLSTGNNTIVHKIHDFNTNPSSDLHTVNLQFAFVHSALCGARAPVHLYRNSQQTSPVQCSAHVGQSGDHQPNDAN